MSKKEKTPVTQRGSFTAEQPKIVVAENVKGLILGKAKGYVKMIQNQLNNRPRKRLGFKTPNEVFMQSVKVMDVVV